MSEKVVGAPFVGMTSRIGCPLVTLLIDNVIDCVVLVVATTGVPKPTAIRLR